MEFDFESYRKKSISTNLFLLNNRRNRFIIRRNVNIGRLLDEWPGQTEIEWKKYDKLIRGK